ncbi:Golgin subfamily A member 7/ERF4 family-domain-containing protein [Tricharina praecox]|uniref:Golgin subfamily A member 7/ERF4 family-domain-containing protein n=1 Tax=Tricharina praecox TaxID=43433 RepID=UPI002220816A|nr:Golgin subfamily A member 7/ERF4 family-domain-containing protein [Tricharina praecox]KAI5854682.1 Golgin subfamily A member 7/ERF4 family-domain-containing protein [Tricharina praecox]
MKLPFQGQQDGQQQHQQHQQHQQRQQHLQLHPQQNHTWLDRGSGELAQDVDLEAGHHPGVPLSNLSHSSLQHSSVAGGDEQDNDDGNEWNSRHPCFPHRNPHVPPDSKEYETTRIIRIGRDYMYSGDLSPAFSYVYPEILEPFVSEVRFREVIKRVNDELYEAHTPWSRANIMEGVVGMLTLWMYEDIVDTKAKRRIENVERYLERVNEELEKEGGAKFIPLRRTGFLKVIADSIPMPEYAIDDLVVAGHSNTRPRNLDHR